MLTAGIFIALKTGGARWDTPSDRSTIIVLIAGYCVYLAMHSLWIWKALQ
jgi:hypothetical protein